MPEQYSDAKAAVPRSDRPGRVARQGAGRHRAPNEPWSRGANARDKIVSGERAPSAEAWAQRRFGHGVDPRGSDRRTEVPRTAARPDATRPLPPPLPPPPRRTHRRSRRPLRLALAILVVVVLSACGAVAFGVKRLDGNITRTDVFSKIKGQVAAPRRQLKGPINFLLLGSDSRVSGGTNRATTARAVASSRTDTIMLVHLQADHGRGYVVSIPRDTFVYVPAQPGQWNGGRAKVNAAYAMGGLPLLVKAIYRFTGVRIDHVIVMDFAGFVKMTDALGGVDVTLPRATYDTQTHAHFRAGVNHLVGNRALLFVRQRHGLPGSDFDRIKRQHEFMSALLAKATSTGTLTSPIRFERFLDAATKSIMVDKDLPVRDVAWQFRNLRPADFTFFTTPIARDARMPGWGSVLLTDKTQAAQLFQAMTADTMAQYITTHQTENLALVR